MNIRALAAPRALETITLHSGAGAALLWLALLWNEAPKWAYAQTYGPICGETSGLSGHCPLCVPAALLTAAALAGAARLLMLRRG